MTLSEAISRLYDLRPGTTSVEQDPPHERPHKPLLLLAALDLIDQGLAAPTRIPWSQELRDRFSARFLLVAKLNDRNNPENPFFYLQTQKFWDAWIQDGPNQIPLQTTPLVGLALKNHHRAMNPYLIASSPDLHWHVSAVIDPHRSNREEPLIALAGKSVHLPQNPAFHPRPDGTKSRCQKSTA